MHEWGILALKLIGLISVCLCILKFKKDKGDRG